MEVKKEEQKMKNIRIYWIFTLIGTLLISFYPFLMGYRVLKDMATQGTVFKEDFPKYIIPYTPIAIAVMVAVILMPLIIKMSRKFAVLVASMLSLSVFFVTELLFESKVIVTGTVETTLESWQMYMCYVPPTTYETRTWKAVDVLIGDYSPTFKIHFYMISVVLIIAILNCLYGYGQMLYIKNYSRCKALVVQSVCTVIFLGLCIFACFTAFFRDGEITVSALSALLMSIFFIVLGITAGTYTGSFLIGKKRLLSVILPSLVATIVTLGMYVGEMFLLSGHLYRYGVGFMFEGIAGIVLAPIDILIIVLAGMLNAIIMLMLEEK